MTFLLLTFYLLTGGLADVLNRRGCPRFMEVTGSEDSKGSNDAR